MIRFNPRLQAEALARLRDDLHLAAFEHVNKVAVIYDRSEELRIPMQPMSGCVICSRPVGDCCRRGRRASG
jgi:hypothetical protein